MATAETVQLGEPHAPKEASIKTFKEIELDLKKLLCHTRHEHNKHEKQYFEAVSHLDDHQLAGFKPEDFVLVRVGESAYGYHLFGKVRIPAMPEDGPAYIHFRAWSPGPDSTDPPKLHAIHTEEKEGPDGDKTFRAIFTKEDDLVWFNT